MAVPDAPAPSPSSPVTCYYTATPIECPSTLIPRTSPPRQQVLWIGCSDSGFEETMVLDLAPDETIVLRNIGNMVVEDDLSCASMLEYAVRVLRINHIVVCGHYGCGIVSGRTAEKHLPLGPHFRKLDSEHERFASHLTGVSPRQRDDALVEMNVLQQVHDLRLHPEVARGIDGWGLQTHALVFDREANEWVRLGKVEGR